MKYAVIKTGGKQYKVSEGQIIQVERLSAEPDSSITFSDVLLVAGENSPQVGTPLISNMQVVGKVLGDVKGDKIRVAKYKAKVRYRRVTGHRQSLTKVQIESIGSAGNTQKTERTTAAKSLSKTAEKTAKK